MRNMWSYRARVRTMLVIAATLVSLGSAPVQAGLIRSERLLENIVYIALPVRALNDSALRTSWSDQVDYVDLAVPGGASVLTGVLRNADGRALQITLLDAKPACGKRECPFRVYSPDGALLLDVNACRETAYHFMAADRKSVTLCGVHYGLAPKPARLVAPNQTPVRSRAMWHNGSMMEASFQDNGEVQIRYARPRSGLPLNLRGQLLFEGRVDGKRSLTGTAYTFKSGCEPAAYEVFGSIDGETQITLSGRSPQRDPASCAVIGFTRRSPNARLSFVEAASLAD